MFQLSLNDFPGMILKFKSWFPGVSRAYPVAALDTDFTKVNASDSVMSGHR